VTHSILIRGLVARSFISAALAAGVLATGSAFAAAPGITGGTETPLPFASIATKVRYADDTCFSAPVTKSSTQTLTPSSIEVRNARLTDARRRTSCPIFTG